MSDATFNLNAARATAQWPLAASSLLLAGIWAALSWPWLSGHVTIPWDGKAHFAPQVQFLAASLGRGEAPWWNPFVFAGHPQIADPQSMIFSPPMLLLSVLNAAPSLQAIDAAVLATVLFGGVGFVAYARHAGLGWTAALIGALVFMFGGSMAWRLQHFGQVMSLAYVPFALVCLRLAILEGRIWAGVAAGGLGAAVLLGRDQVGLLAIYTLAAYAIYLLFRPPVAEFDTRREKIRRAVLPLGLGALAGLALVAIPLVLTLLLADQSNRPTIDLAGASAGSLHPALLITSLAPDLYGSAGEMENFWGPPSFAWEGTGLFTAQNMGVVYIGILPLMILVAAFATGAALKRDALFFTAAFFAMLLYALGWFTPFFSAAYALVPGVDKFRRPADATFLIGGFAAFVIAHSADTLARRWQADVDWRVVLLVTGALGLLASAAVGVALSMDRLDQAMLPLLSAAAASALTAGALAVAHYLRPIRPGLAGLLLTGLVAADIGWHNGPNGATALPTDAINMLQPLAPHPTVAALDRLLAQDRATGVHPRVEMLGLGYHWANASITHRLPNTLGSNPVRLNWYVEATGARDYVPDLKGRQFTPLMPSYDARFAALLGLKYVVTPKSAAQSGKLAGFTEAADAGGNVIFERQAASIPRVVFAPRAAPADFARALASGALPDVDLAR
ncbi:MAG: hypothetical protein AAFV26_06560, partial [Pseudomonadota bacterium]